MHECDMAHFTHSEDWLAMFRLTSMLPFKITGRGFTIIIHTNSNQHFNRNVYLRVREYVHQEPKLQCVLKGNFHKHQCEAMLSSRCSPALHCDLCKSSLFICFLCDVDTDSVSVVRMNYLLPSGMFAEHCLPVILRP